MRTVVRAIALTLILSTSAFAADWGMQVLQVWRSIVYLQLEYVAEDGETARGTCTAFSIDEKKSIYMTAAHCHAEKMTLDGNVEAVPVYISDAEDIMVLQAVTPYRKPALHPARNVYPGQEVAALGYGMGFNQPMVRAGIISIVALDAVTFEHRLYNIYDFAFVGGMSGGPIFNLEGRVVGLLNASYRDGTMGAGRPVEALRKAWPQWK